MEPSLDTYCSNGCALVAVICSTGDAVRNGTIKAGNDRLDARPSMRSASPGIAHVLLSTALESQNKETWRLRSRCPIAAIVG